MTQPAGGLVDAYNRLMHAESVLLLRAAGIDCLVIKGPTIADWLYAPGERNPGDVDLLISPLQLRAAEQALEGRYVRLRPGTRASEWTDRAVPFRRLADGPEQELDLHVNFYGVNVDGSVLWQTLWASRSQFEIAGHDAWMPAEVSRTLLVVLHAAKDGGRKSKTAEDLRRCLSSVSDETLRMAYDLATDLKDSGAFVAGLSTCAEGRALMLRLQLPSHGDPRWRLSTGGGSALAVRLAEVVRLGAKKRVRILLSELWPTRAFMAYDWPLARRGGIWVTLARFQRLFSISRRLPAAWAELVAARREKD